MKLGETSETSPPPPPPVCIFLFKSVSRSYSTITEPILVKFCTVIGTPQTLPHTKFQTAPLVQGVAMARQGFQRRALALHETYLVRRWRAVPDKRLFSTLAMVVNNCTRAYFLPLEQTGRRSIGSCSCQSKRNMSTLLSLCSFIIKQVITKHPISIIENLCISTRHLTAAAAFERNRRDNSLYINDENPMSVENRLLTDQQLST